MLLFFYFAIFAAAATDADGYDAATRRLSIASLRHSDIILLAVDISPLFHMPRLFFFFFAVLLRLC